MSPLDLWQNLGEVIIIIMKHYGFSIPRCGSKHKTRCFENHLLLELGNGLIWQCTLHL